MTRRLTVLALLFAIMLVPLAPALTAQGQGDGSNTPGVAIPIVN